MILLGHLDRVVTIRAVTKQELSAGAFDFTETTVRTAFANVREMGSKERFIADREVGVRMAAFKFHYNDAADVTNKHRLQYDGHTWDILGIRELGYREAIEITAEAVDVDA